MARPGLTELLHLAGDRIDAADVLDRKPHRAESMRVLARALQALEEAVTHLQTEPRAHPSTLRPADVQALVALRQRLELAPAEDAQLSPADSTTLRDARRLALRVLRVLERATRTRSGIVARRLAWVLGVLVVVVLVVCVLCFKDRFEATASARYAPFFGAPSAIDGNKTTEWLAPDATPVAWLDLTFKSPINVQAVQVLNARNAPYNDRGTKVLEVILFGGEKIAARTAVTLPEKTEPELKHVDVSIAARGVTRVRFLARSHYGKGAGLAEVRVIEQVIEQAVETGK